MLGRRHRFHGYNSLRSVYERGQTIRGNNLSLRFVRRDPSRPYRAAIVVSRKVNKSAVVRNRLRRRIYEQVRLNDSKIEPGTDLVFTVFSDKLLDLDPSTLEVLVKELLSKTNP